MGYSAKDADVVLRNYLSGICTNITIIPQTKNRGLEVELNTGEKIVVFVYPLVHKQDGTKNYFDTRDSGAYERMLAWNYAIENNMKYFCLGVNDSVSKYVDYVFSLECEERIVQDISGTLNGQRRAGEKGNQIIIPNTYIPSKSFDRIKNNIGVYIAVIHKNSLLDYLTNYDNRPYLLDNTILPIEPENKPNYYTNLQTKYSRNRIMFGAPGTGKSHTIKIDCERMLGKDSCDYERVTFHSDYSYAAFVGTYKPVPTVDEEGRDSITYTFVPGPFLRILIKALNNAIAVEKGLEKPKPYVLIVEEINRAHIAAVFGDVFQLLDRDGSGASEYDIHVSEDMRDFLSKALGCDPASCEKIRIPDNMFIWATMNSADQGVFPMDTAFKRRWSFKYIGVDDEEVDPQTGKENQNDSFTIAGETIEWNVLRRAINAKLCSDEIKLHEDKLMGSFFLKILDDKGNSIFDDSTKDENFIELFCDKVLMYLFEDAAKTKRKDLFKGCEANKLNRFSYVCEQFKLHGIRIFGDDFKKSYYDKEMQSRDDKIRSIGVVSVSAQTTSGNDSQSEDASE